MGKRSLRNDQGAALVELALTLPLLCLVLIGSVELGRMAYASIEVSNAARAAVAFSSQNLLTASQDPVTKAIVAQVAAADAADLKAMGATLTTNPTTACACINGSTSTPGNCSTLAQWCCPPNETCAASTSTGTGVVYVKATTSATVNTIFHYPGIPSSFTLNGFAQMRVVEY